MSETSTEGREGNEALRPGEEESRLREGEAHDEANMLRVERRVNPATGGIKKHYGEGESEPDADDYKFALLAIERLKKAANDEPTYQKVLLQILRVAARPMQDFFHALDAISPVSDKTFEEMHEKRMHALDDAEKRLQDMQFAGEQFGQTEARRNKTTRELRHKKTA